MYHQINPTETFGERHLTLLREAEGKRRARRRLRAPKAARTLRPPHKERKETEMIQTIDKRRSGTGWNRKALGACLMVVATLLAACLMLAAQPAHASTTFTVNSTADDADGSPLDGACDVSRETDGVCTLRAAIQQANATSGADTINFNIPGTGVQTIHVNSEALQGGRKTLDRRVALPSNIKPRKGPTPATTMKGASGVIASTKALENTTTKKLRPWRLLRYRTLNVTEKATNTSVSKHSDQASQEKCSGLPLRQLDPDTFCLLS